MSSSTSSTQSAPTEESKQCLARSVVEALGAEPTLEAFTIDRVHRTIAVATLGKIDEPRLVESVSGRIRQAYVTGHSEQCQLLQGAGDCQTCGRPLSIGERRQITIQHTGEKTTIARVTCPTAPRFWRWRNIPWPKVVPREVELHDDDHGVDEWKA